LAASEKKYLEVRSRNNQGWCNANENKVQYQVHFFQNVGETAQVLNSAYFYGLCSGTSQRQERHCQCGNPNRSDCQIHLVQSYKVVVLERIRNRQEPVHGDSQEIKERRAQTGQSQANRQFTPHEFPRGLNREEFQCSHWKKEHSNYQVSQRQRQYQHVFWTA